MHVLKDHMSGYPGKLIENVYCSLMQELLITDWDPPYG